MKVGASHGIRASIGEEAILTDDTGTVFKRVDYKLADLLTYIDMGDLDLPDIQRPFVWRASKVRDRSSPDVWCKSVVGMVSASGRRQCAYLHELIRGPGSGQHCHERLL